jgi:hypothetical protein
MGVAPHPAEKGIGGEALAVNRDDSITNAQASALRGTSGDEIEDGDGGGRRIEGSIVVFIEANFNGIGRTANSVHPSKSEQDGGRTKEDRNGKEKWTRETGPPTQREFGRGVGHSQYRVRFEGTRVNDLRRR